MCSVFGHCLSFFLWLLYFQLLVTPFGIFKRFVLEDSIVQYLKIYH